MSYIEEIIVEAYPWRPDPEEWRNRGPSRPTFARLVDQIVKRFQQSKGKITAATLAALLGEVALIALIEYFENVQEEGGELTKVQKDLYEMAEAGIAILASEESIIDQGIKALEASATGGAAAVDPGPMASEQQEEIVVDNKVAPVTAHPTEEIVVYGNVVEGSQTSLNVGAAPGVDGVEVTIPNEGKTLIGGAVSDIPMGVTKDVVDAFAKPTTPQEEEINRILGVTPLGTTVDVVTGVEGINTIPRTSVTIGPTTLAEGTGLNVHTNVGTVEAAITESMTPRDDIKPKGLWYLALLRYVNKSFGRLTELDDWQAEIKKNIYLPGMRICRSNGACIQIKPGTPMDAIPLQYQAVVFKAMGNGELFNDIEIDTEGLIIDLFIMELVDAMIGLSMRTERNIVDAAGLRGIFDYGNPSTWLRRFEKFTGQPGEKLRDYVDFTDPDFKRWYDDYRRRLRERTGEKFVKREKIESIKGE